MAGKAVPDIVIDGTPLGPISVLTLEQPWNDHHSFSIVCPYRERSGALMELGRTYVGKPITIQLRAGIRAGNGQLTFKGIITNVKLSKQASSVIQLVLQGFSPTRLLDDGPHNRSFSEQSLADVIQTVTGDFPDLATKVDVRYTEPLPYVTQYRETAYRFLRRLTATHGEWFYYDGETARFGAPAEGEESELLFGKDLSGMEVTADVVPANFKLLGYDYVGDQHFDVSAERAKVRELDDFSQLVFDTSVGLFQHAPVFAEPFTAPDKVHLEHFAERRRGGQSANLINLFAESSRLDLQVGQVVNVRTVPGNFNGNASESADDYGSFRLLRITHHCDGMGNYHNTFQGIPANLEVPPISDHNIAPPAAETQPAEVTDNQDPEQLGRVRVTFAWQKESGEQTPWLRVAAAGAGGGHGAYFVPETGDQVMVGFEYNNPDRPVVLGSVYHGSVKPANAADPSNNSKIIRTRSGNQVILSDADGEESITIENGMNFIRLSLQGDTSIDIMTAGDLNLTGKNITITAEENITVSAGQAADLSAGQGFSVSAGQDLSLTTNANLDATGQNINLSAQMSVAASGGLSAEFSSANTTLSGDATVTVTAPMVKLN
ncbi:Rhs element Vgr protein [Neolewinella xylanilytica]|uniref:Rhs element Vgr protein n=1 Tax=Neolewinella xylanilytica TaxID=1514080 RepID=A0A2S6IBD4_9BACT|nr:type VI secretion system tip protein VgrG [Neolewinella xylanilytica]PPK88776.1 Rhs element Vgr protein [Neolewinella xylanilytica]